MNAKRMMLSAAALLSLVGCHKWEGPSDDPGIELAMSQILAAPALQMHGATRNVPSAMYPTIAAALGAAKPGDVVRVAANALPYKECPVLVDGVTIMGPVVPRGQPPAVTLDGASCTNCVVCGDASIVHGATLKGFRIVQAPSFGIYLNGSKGVYISDMAIESATAAGIRSDQSSFVLERSRLLDNGGRASVRITHGSQAILAGNDIQGRGIGVSVDMGRFLDEPGSAPSRAWLNGNTIHDNGLFGLAVDGKGSEVRASGNRYQGNEDGVLVTAGATYVGRDEIMTGNTIDGLVAIGCGLGCYDAACENPVMLKEPTRVTLEGSTVLGNQQEGMFATCGSIVSIRGSTFTENRSGVWVASTWDFGAGHVGSAPSSIRASDSDFTANSNTGVLLGENGTRLEGFGNRYRANSGFGINIYEGAEYVGHGDTIAANANDGLVLWMGTKAEGLGNRYEGNPAGISLNGGATYTGQGDTFLDNGVGVWALGCQLVCANPDCTELAVVEGRTQVKLNKSTISGSGSGLFARCGAEIELQKSTVSQNWTGANVASTYWFDETHKSLVPSSITASDTDFTANQSSGLWLMEKGTMGQGLGNRFKGNWDGIHVTGGADYVGRGDILSGHTADGVFVLGCELVCSNADCSQRAVVQEQSRVRLERAAIRDNLGQGVVAGCGAVIDLEESVSAGNGNGAVALAYIDFGDGYDVMVPSTISSHGTVFAGNVEWGVISYDSWLMLGSTENPGENSFLSNGVGSIANVSPNPVLAQWNWFGTTNAAVIASTIGVDVTYEPFLSRAPRGNGR